MQFDLSTVETSTMVFFGTLVVALAVALFILAAAFAALVLVGVLHLAWLVTSRLVLGLVRRVTYLWDGLVRHAAAVELPQDFHGGFRAATHGQDPAPSSGTYPRVALRDS